MFWFELPYSLPTNKKKDTLHLGSTLLGSPRPGLTTILSNPIIPKSFSSSTPPTVTPVLSPRSQPLNLPQSPPTIHAVDYLPPDQHRPTLTITDSELPLLPDAHSTLHRMPTEQVITSTFPSNYTEGNTPAAMSPEVRPDRDRNPFDLARPGIARLSSDSGRTKFDSPPANREGGASGSGSGGYGDRATSGSSGNTAVAAAVGVVVPAVPIPEITEGPLSTLVVDDDK